MKARVVTSTHDFDALAPLWRDIVQERNDASPFSSHDWFSCCWRTASPRRAPEVTVVEDTAGPFAVFPLAQHRATVRGVPMRALSFLDSPDTAFADFPVARDIDAAMTRFVESLVARRDWDVLSLPKLPVDSPTVKALTSALEGRLRWRATPSGVSPYVSLSGTWERYFRDKTQRFRKTCRNIENRLQRAGAVSLEEHRTVGADDAVFAELMEVSRRSWKAPHGVAVATMDGMQQFFRELTPRASANGWLHLWILRLDGRAVATEYQIAGGGVVHALRADYDAAVGDLSPGAYLNAAIVRTLFERRDIREYDMGPGMNEYKLRWASGTHESVALDVYGRTALGRALYAVETRLIPIARRCRAAMTRIAP